MGMPQRAFADFPRTDDWQTVVLAYSALLEAAGATPKRVVLRMANILKFVQEEAAVVALCRFALASGGEDAFRPDNEYDLETINEVTKSRDVLKGTGNDGPRVSHLQSSINTNVGHE